MLTYHNNNENTKTMQAVKMDLDAICDFIGEAILANNSISFAAVSVSVTAFVVVRSSYIVVMGTSVEYVVVLYNEDW